MLRHDAMREQLEVGRLAPGAPGKAISSDIAAGVKGVPRTIDKPSFLDTKLSSLASLFSRDTAVPSSHKDEELQVPRSGEGDGKGTVTEPPSEDVANIQATLTKLISLLHAQQGISVSQIAKSLNVTVDNKTAALLDNLRHQLITAQVDAENTSTNSSQPPSGGSVSLNVPGSASTNMSVGTAGNPANYQALDLEGSAFASRRQAIADPEVNLNSGSDKHAGVKAALAKLLSQQGMTVSIGGTLYSETAQQSAMFAESQPAASSAAAATSQVSLRLPQLSFSAGSERGQTGELDKPALTATRQVADRNEDAPTSFTFSRNFLASEDSHSSISSDGPADPLRSGSLFIDREYDRSNRGLGISPGEFPERRVPPREFMVERSTTLPTRTSTAGPPRGVGLPSYQTGTTGYRDSPSTGDGNDSFEFRGNLDAGDAFRGTSGSYGRSSVNERQENRDIYRGASGLGDNRDGYLGGRGNYGW